MLFGASNAEEILNSLVEELYSSPGIGKGRSMNFEDVENLTGREARLATPQPTFDGPAFRIPDRTTVDGLSLDSVPGPFNTTWRVLTGVTPRQIGDQLVFGVTNHPTYFLATPAQATFDNSVTFFMLTVGGGGTNTQSMPLLRAHTSYVVELPSGNAATIRVRPVVVLEPAVNQMMQAATGDNSIGNPHIIQGHSD